MSEDEIIRELIQIEHRLARAWVESDRDTIESILASDWITIDIVGRVLTRTELMEEAFVSEERRIDSITFDEMKVRLFDQVAVVTGLTVAEGSFRGQKAKVVLRFTDVFVIRDERWQVVSSQGTVVPSVE